MTPTSFSSITLNTVQISASGNSLFLNGIVFNGGSTVLSPVQIPYATGITPDLLSGSYAEIILTGNSIIFSPLNPLNGAKWKFQVTASGANRNLSLHSGIKIPSASSFTGTQLITGNETWIGQLEYIGRKSQWGLLSLIGGY